MSYALLFNVNVNAKKKTHKYNMKTVSNNLRTSLYEKGKNYIYHTFGWVGKKSTFVVEQEGSVSKFFLLICI